MSDKIISAAIAAVISLTIAFITNIRNSKLKYITEERQKWLENMRINVPRILSTNCLSIERRELLENLRLCLNPRDEEDESIITIIDRALENHSYEILEGDKEEFRNLIQNLLKYEWEKAKYEAGLSFSFQEFIFGITILSLAYLFWRNIVIKYPNGIPLFIIGLLVTGTAIILCQKLKRLKETRGKIKKFLYPIFEKPYRDSINRENSKYEVTFKFKSNERIRTLEIHSSDNELKELINDEDEFKIKVVK